VLLRSIDTQLISLQQTVGFDTPGCKVEANSQGQLPTQTRADDVSMMQAVLLYAIMHIYRAEPTASQCIDRVPLRLMQVSSSMSRSHFHKQARLTAATTSTCSAKTCIVSDHTPTSRRVIGNHGSRMRAYGGM
jgi:hypothetical protein